MLKHSMTLLGLGTLFFAAFSSSTNYQLQSYGVGSGGTNTSSSPSYKLEGNTGETTGSATTGTNDTTKPGSTQAGQANVPPAPTLTNGSSYYNKLQIIIATGSNASDATYTVAVSTNNFSTTSYVQSDGTLNSTPYFQTYSAWGGASGSYIIGLAPSTSYEAKVSAMQGTFSQSAYGAYATATTSSPSITFSLSPTSQNIGSLPSGSVVTGASTINYSLSTNAAYGANIYVSGQNGGLKSATRSYTIPAVSANLSGQTLGFGIQGASASAPLVIDSPFNGTGNTVGAETTSLVPIFTSTAPVTSGTATANLQAKASSTVPSSSDYQEILTFVAAASF